MQVEHILILALSGFGVFHGISIGIFLLFSERTNQLPNRILGLLLVLLGLRISKSIFLYFMADLDYVFITLGLTLILSFGPLFYFYVRSYLDEQTQIEKSEFWHAIPFLIFLVLNSFQLLSKDFYLNFGIYFIYLHFLAYIVYSFLFQRKYWTENVSEKSKVRQKWMIFLHLGIVFIWVSYFMFLLGEMVPYILGPITYSLVIYPLSFWALSKKVLLPKEKKYQASRITPDDSATLISKLESYMQNEEPFLNADIKLLELASELKVTPHVLSQLVNEQFGQNFQQYVNSYRIKKAQEILSSQKYDHLTISSIAFDCGFNSLSAFNSAFKKQVEVTPSEFRKSAQKQ